MEILYRNFDGLDVAFKGQIPPSFGDLLERAKTTAQESKQPALIEYGREHMHVAESGSQGGYAYRCDTGPVGATWFFKKPTAKDAWGIRVSVKSLTLAAYGLGGVRAQIYQFLRNVRASLEPQGESIGRVDYAIDFLMPETFELIPNNFVMHSHTNRKDIEEIIVKKTGGTSGRVTSVTAGTMPGRQVIVYDKRAEVIKKRKVEWWEVWNECRQHQGKPELDPHNIDHGRAWRVEVRAGKDYLKKRWGITTWKDLDSHLGNVLARIMRDIRYTIPSGDSNRSRWPIHPIWDLASDALSRDLFEMVCSVDERIVKEILRNDKREELEKQFVGLAASVGCVMGIDQSKAVELPTKMKELLRHSIDEDKIGFIKKMKRAEERYCFLE